MKYVYYKLINWLLTNPQIVFEVTKIVLEKIFELYG